MAYIKTQWLNDETPLNADNLNHMEEGIEEAVDATEIDASVKALAQSMGWSAGE